MVEDLVLYYVLNLVDGAELEKRMEKLRLEQEELEGQREKA